jgi:3-deoxy-D-manno-octulosonate 8-phosphate phosphatase (KDO 8-P phosphatase)
MQATIEKAKHIRLLILDVDGVLTDGLLYLADDHFQQKGFHVHDGFGIKLLQQAGIKVAVISAKKTAFVKQRLNDLNIEHIYLGYEDKLPAYEEVKKVLQLDDAQIAYMGDDLPDLPVLRRVGLAIAVPHASSTVKQHVDFVTEKTGGRGAVREICELVLQAQDLYKDVIQSYLTK